MRPPSKENKKQKENLKHIIERLKLEKDSLKRNNDLVRSDVERLSRLLDGSQRAAEDTFSQVHDERRRAAAAEAALEQLRQQIISPTEGPEIKASTTKESEHPTGFVGSDKKS